MSWTLQAKGPGWCVYTSFPEIRLVGRLSEISPEDAKLMAAAPDLLAALVDLVNFTKGREEPGGLVAAEKAIAKATMLSQLYDEVCECGHRELSDGYGGYDCPECGKRMKVVEQVVDLEQLLREDA